MGILRKILGFIYFIYGMVLFMITLFLVAIPTCIAMLFPEPRRSNIVHKSYRVWMFFLLNMVFIRVRRKGKGNFQKGETYVVVANHNSFVDILVSVPWIPGPSKTLAKVELAKIPVFGIIYKAGSILVDRKSESSRRESFTKMQEALKMGLHLCLYPEGTRNKGDQPLQRFYDGAFITAIRAQKPIIPAVLLGTKQILAADSKFYAQPGVIDIHFLEPVPTEGLRIKDKDELKDKVYQLMESHIIEYKKQKQS